LLLVLTDLSLFLGFPFFIGDTFVLLTSGLRDLAGTYAFVIDLIAVGMGGHESLIVDLGARAALLAGM
jgi:hypothetical protein